MRVDACWSIECPETECAKKKAANCGLFTISEKPPGSKECVVVSEGLELRARHAVAIKPGSTLSREFPFLIRLQSRKRERRDGIARRGWVQCRRVAASRWYSDRLSVCSVGQTHTPSEGWTDRVACRQSELRRRADCGR